MSSHVNEEKSGHGQNSENTISIQNNMLDHEFKFSFHSTSVVCHFVTLEILWPIIIVIILSPIMIQICLLYLGFQSLNKF